MKRVLTSVFILALSALTAQAQDAKTTMSSGGTTFGLKIGVNLQNVYGKEDNGDKIESDLTTKWAAGINAEIPVATDFYFQPGLTIGTKGAKFQGAGGSAGDDVKLNLYYLDIPLNFIYKPMLGNGHLLLGFGPYVGFGIGGKVITENGSNDSEADVEYRGTVSTADQNSATAAFFKRTDAGANILAGYEFSNRLSFQLNSQIGIANIIPEYEGQTATKAKTRNIGFGLSLGYRFGK